MMLTLAKSPIADIRVLDPRIHQEPLFPCPAHTTEDGAFSRSLIVSRWSGGSADDRPQRAPMADDHHTIGISMESTQARLTVSDSLLYEGAVEAGTIQVSGPDQPVIMESCGSFQWIRLHIGKEFLLKCQTMLRSGARAEPVAGRPEMPFRDLVTYDLVRVVVRLSEASTTMTSFGVESVILAIVLRILGRDARSYPVASIPRAKPLIAWRLRRVKDYVAARLADPIKLADLAKVAGLTRMHFASQFRAATGIRPHEYVLQHRIAHAKRLLLESELRIIDIALATGFQTQAHFTTVFKNLTFSTPYEWRCRERDQQPISREAAFASVRPQAAGVAQAVFNGNCM